MTIFQPRRENVSTYIMTKEELLAWAEEVLKPTAELAYEGKGEFKAGDHCQFCKVKATCRKRAEYNLELARYDFEMPVALEDTEIAAILPRIDSLTAWAADLKEYALQQALFGMHYEGFKVVEGRSNRKYSDEAAVALAAENAGYDPYEKKLLGITAMTALMGKKKFEEGVKPPSQVWHEKGIRKAYPKGGVFVWQHSGMLRMLKNRAYVGDLVQGVYECRKIRDDRRVTDPKKWIVTENHHEPIIDRETFDKVQERFWKSVRKWKRSDHHILVGRVKCGCCCHNLRHSVSGHHYYWCPGLNIYHMDGCVKRIEDFYLEEVILFQLQQHIMELGESDKLLQAEKDAAAAEVEKLKKKCQAAEKAIEKARAKRMAEFEAYALGKKKSYDASIDEVEILRKKHEGLMVELSEAEDRVRELNRMKVHESFAVTKLTEELLDEYVEGIEVHPGDEVRIIWK